MWRLTEDPESVVEGDDDDSAERGEDPGVVEGGGAPGPGLAVHEHQHRQLWVSCVHSVVRGYKLLYKRSFNLIFNFLQRSLVKHASWLLENFPIEHKTMIVIDTLVNWLELD